MSNRATGWAFEQEPSGGALSKLVLVAIADFANQDDEAWPSVATIARRCQMGRSTVLAHVGKLEQEGMLIRTARYTNGRQTSNVYRIPCRPTMDIPTESGVLTREGSTSGTGPPDRGGGSTSGTGGVHQRDGGGSTSGTQNRKEEPTIEPKEEPSAGGLSLVRSDPIVKPLPAVSKPTGRALVERLGMVMDEIATGARARVTAEQARKIAAGIVFAYWMHKFNHPKALLDNKRERVIMARLEENGGDVSELLHAIDGARNDDWVNGTAPNARHANDSVDYILRDRSKVETFANTRKKYQQGKPHDLAAKYAAVIHGEIENGHEPPGITPAGESRNTLDAGGSDGQQHPEQVGTRNAAGAGAD